MSQAPLPRVSQAPLPRVAPSLENIRDQLPTPTTYSVKECQVSADLYKMKQSQSYHRVGLALLAAASSLSTTDAFTSYASHLARGQNNHHHVHVSPLFADASSSTTTTTTSPPAAAKPIEEGSHDELMYTLGVNLARQLGDVRPLVEAARLSRCPQRRVPTSARATAPRRTTRTHSSVGDDRWPAVRCVSPQALRQRSDSSRQRRPAAPSLLRNPHVRAANDPVSVAAGASCVRRCRRLRSRTSVGLGSPTTTGRTGR